MSKLSYLADGMKITIATNNEPFILRDLARNDTAQRVIGLLDADPADPDGSAFNFGVDQLGDHNAIHFGEMANNFDYGADVESILLTVVKVGSGFQVSAPTIAALDTPAKFAAVGFQDTKRTTYTNLFELGKQVAQNAELQTALIGDFTVSTGIGAFVIDQTSEEVAIVGDSSAGPTGPPTIFATVELDDIGSIQFGE